jgi:hypothetical protein
MRHPKPERWAELHRLPAPEREEMARHADACADCARVRDRIASARIALGDITRTPSPDLSWDLLGARLHWSVSSELKRREREAEKRPRRRVMPWLAAGAAAAVAVPLAFYLRREPVPIVTPLAAPVAAPVAGAAPLPAATEGVVTFLQGDAILDAAPIFLDAPIQAGAILRTHRGRVAVQFGDRSGFVVEDDTILEVARLDEQAVELRVRAGAVSIDLTRRRADQRFSVHAGARQVVVRGTVFRVAHTDDALDVVVARGLVAVSEGDDAVEVSAGARLAIPRGGSLGAAMPRKLTERETNALSRAIRVPLVPAWTSAPEVRAATAVLRVAAGPRARVKIDDVDTGVGPLSLRTVAGRHLVEVGGVSRWVELDAGAIAMTTMAPPEPRSERPGQLDAELVKHKAAIGQCAAGARKRDPLFKAEIEIEVGIRASGAVNDVNPVKGLGDRELENCVLGLVRDQFTFPAGTASSVRKKIRF